MPILPICGYCKRQNGYALSESDKVCLRCKKQRGQIREPKEKEEPLEEIQKQ